MIKIILKSADDFEKALRREEKSAATIYKYVKTAEKFLNWCGNREITKELVLEYKTELIKRYAPSSANSYIAALNSYFVCCGFPDLKLKALKLQSLGFASQEKELTRSEYEKLLRAAKAKKNKRLFYMMQTICATGIRVSELKYITTEAVKLKKAVISCKGKTRIVILPSQLCILLEDYIVKKKIRKGAVFVTKGGKPIDRSNIWSDMKSLCEKAEIAPEKVFPHNLRHLFARTFYSLQQDVVHLADILGHSSINTTRIYTLKTADDCRAQIQNLGLVKN